MAKITIRETILDGNLGDGWFDNAKTADALADYTRSVWEKDLELFTAQGYDVVVDISVQYRTTGYSRPVTVSVDDENLLERGIEECLTPNSVIWERFCRSEEIKK